VYCPKLLSAPASIDANALANQATNGRLFMAVGAGVSIPAPTNAPNAGELATSTKAALMEAGLGSILASVPDTDLLKLADAVETEGPTAVSLLHSTILRQFEFKTATPNYAHEVIALLLAEEAIVAVTVNWDLCIEKAAADCFTDLVACRTDEEITGAGSSAVLVKAHGSADIESSLRVSSNDIQAIPWWASHYVVGHLATHSVVFVGVGSIPSYIQQTMEYLLARIPSRLTSLKVVTPSVSGEWTNLLGDDVKHCHIPSSAEPFLDDLLRALTKQRLQWLQAKMAGITVEGIEAAEAAQGLKKILDEIPAHLLWRWVRRGAFPRSCGRVVLDDVFFSQCLYVLALINSQWSIEKITLVGQTVTVQCAEFIVEIARATNGMDSGAMLIQKEAELIASRGRNELPVALPIIVLASGTVGPLVKSSPNSIVDHADQTNLIEGPGVLDCRWVSLDLCATIQNIDNLKTAFGIEL